MFFSIYPASILVLALESRCVYNLNVQPDSGCARAPDFPWANGKGNFLMRDGHQYGVCGEIDEAAIELYAMGRLENGSVRKHLDTCAFCQGRVAEHRSWVEDLKTALEQFRRAEDTSPTGSGADHEDDRSRQDES
jgi:hypothetical protein